MFIFLLLGSNCHTDIDCTQLGGKDIDSYNYK